MHICCIPPTDYPIAGVHIEMADTAAVRNERKRSSTYVRDNKIVRAGYVHGWYMIARVQRVNIRIQIRHPKDLSSFV